MKNGKNTNKYFYLSTEKEAKILGYATRQKYMKFTNKEGQVYYSFVRTEELVSMYKLLKSRGRIVK